MFSKIFLLYTCTLLACLVTLSDARKKMRVLVPGLSIGNHLQYEFEIAKSLSKEKDFLVYFLTSRDFNIDHPESQSLKFFRLPEVKELDSRALIEILQGNIVDWQVEWSNHITRVLYAEKKKHLEALKELKFDMIVGGMFNFDHVLIPHLQTQHVQLFMNLPSPDIQIFQNTPQQTSYTQNKVQMTSLVNKYPHSSFIHRLNNILSSGFWRFNNYLVDNGKLVPFDRLHMQYFFGTGVLGFSDAVQMPQSSEIIYPLTPLSSKFDKDFNKNQLPAKYEKFMDQFENIIVVTFGADQLPKSHEIHKLVQLMSAHSLKKYGFVFGLFEYESNQELVQEIKTKTADISNIFLDSYIPQKKLLNDPRVKLFITNCGVNSLYESIYFGEGTPVLGLPIAFDQFSNCKKLSELEIGIEANFGESFESLLVKVLTLLKDDNVYQKNLTPMNERMTFDEKRSGQNVANFLRHVHKFGSTHFYHYSQLNHIYSARQTYDLDIIAVPLIFSWIIAYILNRYIFKR